MIGPSYDRGDDAHNEYYSCVRWTPSEAITESESSGKSRQPPWDLRLTVESPDQRPMRRLRDDPSSPTDPAQRSTQIYHTAL